MAAVGRVVGALALGVVLAALMHTGSLALGSPGQRLLVARAAASRAAARHPAARSAPRFRVIYSGSGSYHTVYFSEPPNPGAKPDHNFVYDSSRQRWSLTFAQPLELGRQSASADAGGPTSVVAKIDHRHLDGIYAFDDRTVRCRLRSATKSSFPVAFGVRYLPHALVITVGNPVAEALLRLPTECPTQGDPIDGLRDNYLEPGFSFAPGYGAGRWFTASAVVALSELRRGRRISVPMHNTRAGEPPKRCGVEHPASEQCRTGGSWRATLLLQPLQR